MILIDADHPPFYAEEEPADGRRAFLVKGNKGNKVAHYQEVVAKLKEKLENTTSHSCGRWGRGSWPRSNEPRGRKHSPERRSRDERRREEPTRSRDRSGHRNTGAGSPSRPDRTPVVTAIQGYPNPTRTGGSPGASGGGAGVAAAERGGPRMGQGGAAVMGRVRPGDLLGGPGAAEGTAGNPPGGSNAAGSGLGRGGHAGANEGGWVPADRMERRGPRPPAGPTVHGAAAGGGSCANDGVAGSMAAGCGPAVSERRGYQPAP